MNSIQIGSAATAPVSVRPSVFFSSRPVHDADGDIRIEADEPGVGVFVDRAGLAAERPVDRGRRFASAAEHERRATGWS
jgi:hypothetical protein